MSDHEAEARARLATKEGRIEAITQRAYSRRFGSGNSNYIRECADDEYELLGFLADAEARAERLAKYLSGFDVTEDGEMRDEDGEPYEDTFIVNIGMQVAGIKEIHAALTDAAHGTGAPD